MLKKRPILRALALLVAAASLLGLLEGQRLFPQAKAETMTPYRWFYDQLQAGTMEKEFYDALLHMLNTGILDADGSYEIPLDSNPAIAAAMAGFNGNMTPLTNAMAKARDGFECDYPDVFWVDYSMLTVRVTKDAAQNLHVYLGTGRGTSYFVPGMTAADLPAKKAEYESAMASALAWIQEQEPTYEGEPASKTLATAAHDYLTTHMVYHFEYEVDHAGCNSRTAYDALVYQEGVCEAYTRAYKALLDRLGVESVSVTGTYYVSPGEFEPHAWSNVKIEGQWYGVDVTHDDPRVRDGWDMDLTKVQYTNNRNSGKENHVYLLVGDWDLRQTHKPFGIMSPANYTEYAYPTMDTQACRRADEFTGGGLRVIVVENEDSGGVALISFNGKPYWENVNSAGYYFVYRGYDQWHEDSEVKVSDWCYMTPEFYGENIVDVYGPADKFYNEQYYELMGGPYTRMPLTNQKGFQIGVVNQKPDTSQASVLNGSLYLDYYGYTDQSQFIAVSEVIENFQFEPYAPPPFPFKVTPTQTSFLPLGTETFHVRAEFNQKLVFVEGKDQVEIEYTAEQYRYADLEHTAREHTYIDHVTFNGDNVIEFDFHPSKMFNDNETIYTLYFKNVVGEESRKEPMPIAYVVSMDECAYCYKSQGYDWNVFAYPRLLESEEALLGNDMTVQDTETGTVEALDGELLEKVSHRLTLVTSEVTNGSGQNEAMMDALEKSTELMDEIGGADNIVRELTHTYNIKLSLCKKMVVKTGQGVRISMGFPEGTSYEDFASSGTFEFKVYHYLVDPATDELTGEVEEVPVTVVPQGLILLVKSFSPFTIATVRVDPATKEERLSQLPVSAIVTSTEGGVLTGPNGQTMTGENAVLQMRTGEQKAVHIQAKEGYQIEAIHVADKIYPVNPENASVYDFTITSDMIDALKTNSTFHVDFISKSILEQDALLGQTEVVQENKEPPRVDPPKEEPPKEDPPKEDQPSAGEPHVPTSPSQPSQPSQPSGQEPAQDPPMVPAVRPQASPNDTPKTGDETNFVVLFVLLGASAVGVGVSVYLLRKKPKDRKRSKK